MTRLVPGDTLDCLGPLGEPFVTSNNMLLVGGGVGIAPSYASRLTCKTVKKHKLFWALEMKVKPSGRLIQRYACRGYISLLMMVA